MSLADLAAEEVAAATAERERLEAERREAARAEAFEAVSAVLTRRDGRRVPAAEVGMWPIGDGLPDGDYGWGDASGVGLVARNVEGEWIVLLATKTDGAWVMAGQRVYDLASLGEALGQ